MLGIVTPTFNRKHKTYKFLECLERQTFEDFKLFIVDSGSTDGTVDAVQAGNWSFDVEVIVVSSDKFWTGATNAGVKKALAEGVTSVMTLNDDAVFSIDYLASMLELAERFQLQILTSRIDYLNKKKIWMLGSENNWRKGKLFYSLFHGMNPQFLPICYGTYDVVEVQSGCGNGVLIKSTVFHQIGLYDELNCPHYHGDSEFLLRARKAGLNIFSTTKILLCNDYSDFKGIWANGLSDIWKSIRSPHYYPAVSWIVQEYGPSTMASRVKILYYSRLIIAFLVTRRGFEILKGIRVFFGNILIFSRKLILFGLKCIRKSLIHIERRY